MGRDWLESDGPTEPPDLEVDPRGFNDIFERLFLRSVALEMADDLLDLIGEVRPDVLIREPVEFAGSAAAVPDWIRELDGAVYVSFGTVFPRHFPQVLGTAADPSYRAAATGLARDLASMPGPERAVAALEELTGTSVVRMTWSPSQAYGRSDTTKGRA